MMAAVGDVEVATGYRALARVICGSPGQPRRWAARAACAGMNPGAFTDEAADESRALAVCAGCPVLLECRADALAFEASGYRWRQSPTGVVGGMTADQRKAIHRANAKDARRCARSGDVPLLSAGDVAVSSARSRSIGRMVREAVTVHRRILRPGETWVSITGQRGRFRYLGYSVSALGDVSLTVFGGRPGRELIRSFRPSQVRTVHRRGGAR